MRTAAAVTATTTTPLRGIKLRRHRRASSGPRCSCVSFGLAARDLLRDARRRIAEAPFVQTLFTWMPAGDLQVDAALQLDQLSMVMTLVVTGVGR